MINNIKKPLIAEFLGGQHRLCRSFLLPLWMFLKIMTYGISI